MRSPEDIKQRIEFLWADIDELKSEWAPSERITEKRVMIGALEWVLDDPDYDVNGGSE